MPFNNRAIRQPHAIVQPGIVTQEIVGDRVGQSRVGAAPRLTHDGMAGDTAPAISIIWSDRHGPTPNPSVVNVGLSLLIVPARIAAAALAAA